MDKSGNRGKIIVLSAPSGTGKSTIVKRLMEDSSLGLEFSVSATSRKPRGMEQHGKEYYFLSPEEFQRHVEAGDFVEWEEVYSGTCYGTLVGEVRRVTESGHNLIMDIDVAGALNVKRRYDDEALTIFILPPDLDVLEQRLRTRGTDDEASILKRLGKAEHEISYAPRFDCRVVNDNLDEAVAKIKSLIADFVQR